jgi:hypothetical protein
MERPSFPLYRRKGKRRDCGKYGPISVLNLDYKLARRIENILPELIHLPEFIHY